MLNCVLVGFGGFIGAVLRYLVSLIPIKNPVSFPVNTFIINIAGAFAIGCIAFAVSKNENIDPKLLLFLKVGICGGFTTFSTFSLETAELLNGGSVVSAVVYVLASVVLSVLAVMTPQLVLK
ncbi:MAG: fluoride efflux transporter CrcB [Acetobacter sp.]|nr:fluoride efflux transporter CrcB [Bacteroides sp.]MCM1340171.1 fluoride efflux transporter CrcB [Acetobacter sp.]MCM1432877.1 fluoride efflux transporter CrcB [Clostridiales bacterium]